MERREFLRAVALAGLTCLLPLEARAKAAQKGTAVVVGAGISGLAAARALAKAGWKVDVVEARPRIGGRMITDTSLGIPVDLGAAWIHGPNGNPVADLAKGLNIRLAPTDWDSLGLYDHGKRASAAEVKRTLHNWDALEKRLRRAKAQAGGSDLGTALGQATRRMNLSAADARLVDWIATSNIVSEYGADPQRMAFHEWDEEEEMSGGDMLPVGGYSQVVRAVAKGLTVHLSTPVRRIEWSENGAAVVADKKTWRADACVVTLPLGVLKQGGVAFSPALPKDRTRIVATLDMGVLDKLVLRFPKTAWPGDAKIFADVGDPIFNEFVDVSDVVGAPVLVGLTGGARARTFERLSEREAVERAMSVLRGMFGAALAAPTGVLRTRWAADPLSLGSYSYIPVGGRLRDLATLAKPLGALYFAGEHTHPKYPATVHGAYLSGLRAARQVLEESEG